MVRICDNKLAEVWKIMVFVCVSITLHSPLSTLHLAYAQAPGTTPVVVSNETQMLHGRKYYVHIVERGQTVYSIAKAYKVQSFDAVTHVDIHYLHAGDTVWLPCRGQFSEAAKGIEERSQNDQNTRNAQNNQNTQTTKTTVKSQKPPVVRKTGKTLKVAVMMPLYLDKLDEISTSKFDIEQRGKKSYRQFEFIEFYEGVLMALEQLADEGVSVELNVVDVSESSAAKVEEAFESHHVAQSDVIIALLLRDAFDRAAQLAQEAGVYIVNPMATRSEICAGNPYMVKVQPSMAGLIECMLRNMKAERPNAHLYIVHSGAKAERAVMDELKRQLDERGDIKYTVFNWSQSAKMASVLKQTPECNVLSIYDQGKDQNRVFAGNLMNRLAAFKTNTPKLYTLNDWTHDYSDVDLAQLQMLGYHTFSTSWDMTNEVHVGFLKAFRTRYGTEPTSSLAATGYDLTLSIVGGLHRKGADFWSAPFNKGVSLTQPLYFKRSGAGLENCRATLYRMENLHFVPAATKGEK